MRQRRGPGLPWCAYQPFVLVGAGFWSCMRDRVAVGFALDGGGGGYRGPSLTPACAASVRRRAADDRAKATIRRAGAHTHAFGVGGGGDRAL